VTKVMKQAMTQAFTEVVAPTATRAINGARTRGLGLVVLAMALFVCAPLARPQDAKPEAQLRTVHGVILDKSENPVPAAVVFLKNLRNNAVRSYIADNEGNYRFSGLDPNVDYEIHAEKDGAKSVTRTISSLDGRKDTVLNLKLEKRKA
jgi:hypothetical protein